MSKNEMEALRAINRDLRAGIRYGKFVHRWPSGDGPRYPYFDRVLEFGHSSVNSRRGLFIWENYGSSANAANLQELAWIIKTIFKMTPSAFRAAYGPGSAGYGPCVLDA